MISRRIIRIKVLQILYAYYSNPEKSIGKSEKELFFSIQKVYDLYHYLLLLLIDLSNYAEERIEIKKNKLQPTQEDLNPNRKFVDNRLIQQLKNNIDLEEYLRKNKLSWVNHPELIKELYTLMIESDFYKDYLKKEDDNYSNDRKFIIKLYDKVILLSLELHTVLEEQSIYWNDDVEFVISMINKSLKKFDEDSTEEEKLMPLFKDMEDKNFTKDLFRKSILNDEEIKSIIEEHSKNWDVERIAFIDNLIMQLAITEFLYLPSIPSKVSLNEYIELSKYYSTPKSRNFINGILDKTLKDLKSAGKINKQGRGLIGE